MGPSRCHLGRDGSLVRRGQRFPRNREYDIVLDPDVLFVNRLQLAQRIAKKPRVSRRKRPAFEACAPQSIDIGMQRVGTPMFLLERLLAASRRKRIHQLYRNRRPV